MGSVKAGRDVQCSSINPAENQGKLMQSKSVGLSTMPQSSDYGGVNGSACQSAVL